MAGDVSLGVAGAVGPEVAARLAPDVAAAGFRALWVNDTPDGDALEALAAAAAVTDTLVLAAGVIDVTRRPAAEIVTRVRALGLPEERLVIGIGAGGRRSGALALMTDAVTTLRAETDAQVYIGALGPRMRRVAATHADGVVLNWLTPDAARTQAAQAHDVAPRTRVVLYARTALDPAALPPLRAEAERYGSIRAYADNFARLGVAPTDTVIEPEDASSGIRAYRDAVDELVLRAVTPRGDGDDLRRFVDAAARLL